MSLCNQLTIGSGYNRGFSHRYVALDYWFSFEYLLSKVFQEDALRVTENEDSSENGQKRIISQYKDFLTSLLKDDGDIRKTSTNTANLRSNARIIKKIDREMRFASENPDKLLKRIQSMPPEKFVASVGEQEGRLKGRTFLTYIKIAVRWRLLRQLNKIGFPFTWRTGRCLLISDIWPVIDNFFASAKSSPWYLHFHFMEVHDSTYCNRPIHLLMRLRYYYRWRKAYKAGKTNRSWQYDTALMYLDRYVGKIARLASRRYASDEIIYVITGDHGRRSANPFRTRKSIGLRLNCEDIEVPLLVSESLSEKDHQPNLDSMSIAKTILDIAKISAPPAFKGKSIGDAGCQIMISENTGAGLCDPMGKPIYFAAEDKQFKIIGKQHLGMVTVFELYDKKFDSEELNNLLLNTDARKTVEGLVERMIEERQNIYKCRGINWENFDLTLEPIQTVPGL
jgi:hypothetical protein